MTHNLFSELEHEFRSGLAGVKFIEYAGTARLGDGDDAGDVPVPAADRQYPTFPLFWVYREGNTSNEVFQAVPWYPGLTYDNSQRHMEVFLVRFPMLDPKLHWIFGFTDIGLAAWNGVTPLQAGLANAAVVTPDKIFTCSIYPAGGLVVGFRGGWVRKANRRYWLNSNASLLDVSTPTDYRPASGYKKWIGLSVSTAGAVSVVQGSSFDENDASPRNYQPVTVTDGNLDLGAILLSNGQTDLEATWGTIAEPRQDMYTVPHDVDTAAAASTTVHTVQFQDATVANTTSETTIIGTVVGDATLAADTLALGTVLHITGGGYYSAAAGTPSLTLKFKLGGTEIVATSAMGLAEVTDAGYRFEVWVTTQSIGASGTVVTSGTVQTNATMFALVKTTTTTIDTTGTLAVDVTATWGTADAANTITSQVLMIETKSVG